MPSGDLHVPFGWTGKTLENSFQQFTNDVCPEFCPYENTCGELDYSVKCRDMELDPEGVYHDPSTLGFTARVDSVITEVEYEVFISSVDKQVIEKDYKCIVEGSLQINPSSYAATGEFNVTFEVCTRPEESCGLGNEWRDIYVIDENYRVQDPLEIYIL